MTGIVVFFGFAVFFVAIMIIDMIWPRFFKGGRK